MAAAEKKGKPVDLAIILGGKGKPEGDETGEGAPIDGGGDDLPPGFMSAFEEYEMAETPEERASAFYRAIEACKGM